MLNFDRDLAVKLFLELCDGSEDVLGTPYADQFIHYATYRHYSLLRPVLIGMLTGSHEKQVPVAARQITVAAFHQLKARDDLEQVVSGNAICRKEAAGVFARNVGHPKYAAVCSTWLAKFFQDSDSDVRAAAADCFRNLPSNLLSSEKSATSHFIDSPACIDNSHQLIHSLEDSTELLPDVICRIPERLIAEHRSATPGQNFESRRWIYHLPALVARLYEQSADLDIKRRCLDIIDGMLELHVSEIEKELEQVER